MVLVAEVAMACIGLYLLIVGKARTSKQVLQGWPARLAGLIFLLPLPICFYSGVAIGLGLALQRRQYKPREWRGFALRFELSAIVICLVAGGVIALVYRKPVKRSRKKVEPVEE